MPEPLSTQRYARSAIPCAAKLLAVIGAVLLAAGPLAVLAQSPPASSTSKSATAQPNKSAAPTSLDALKTPAGAIVVICDKAAEGFRLVPRGILLAPESYQHLLDQIEQLKNKLQTTARTPAVCTLSGRVDGAVVQLVAEFEFATTQPRSLVNLGCQRALPKSATLDGHLPVLSSSDDGLVVQVDKPGVHRLTLGLEASWSARVAKAGERSFDVGLPRAAITR